MYFQVKNLTKNFKNSLAVNKINFDDPDKVVEYANTLEFSSSETGRWPGKRSNKLHDVNRELFNYICSKIYNIFYPFGVSKYQVSMSFQYIEPYCFDNKGCIHRERNEFGGIVYLTKNPEVGTGTSIYKPTRGWFDSSVYVDIKKKYYINEKSFYNVFNNFHLITFLILFINNSSSLNLTSTLTKSYFFLVNWSILK